MVTYQKKENNYYYNLEDVNNIIDYIKNNSFYNPNQISRESVEQLLNLINSFLDNIETKEEIVEAQRHETEEEARTYFGEEFIKQFDELLTRLDKEDTVVAIHGTTVDNCPQILEEGLKYKGTNIYSTAVIQQMNYGTEDMHYSEYETLLNWPHKLYKGLVLVAIPYECTYKEGLWNHYQDADLSMYGIADYKINPDFIVGYIDVENKKIVLNPKYRREHNYEGLEKDRQIYREDKDLDNDKYRSACIEYKKAFANREERRYSYQAYEQEVTLENLPYLIDELIGTFNGIKLNDKRVITEERYKMLLNELSFIKNIKKILPELKTIEELKKAEEDSPFGSTTSSSTDTDDVFVGGDELDADWIGLEDAEETKFY